MADFFKRLPTRIASLDRARVLILLRRHWVALAYLVFVLVGATVIGVGGAPTEDEAMTWTVVVDKAKVSAKPAGLWTWMLDDVAGPALIKIETTPGGKWFYASGKHCEPDGDLGSVLKTDNALLKDAPIGALIAKIGGSTAGVADGKKYVVGSKAIIRIDDKGGGPILLTINDERSGFADNTGEIEVTISVSPTSAPPPDPPEDPPADDTQ